MDENPYRAPKEKGAKTDGPPPWRVWVAAIAAAFNLILCGGWMIYTARKPAGLAWWQALAPTLMVAATLFGLALSIREEIRRSAHRPTR